MEKPTYDPSRFNTAGRQQLPTEKDAYASSTATENNCSCDCHSSRDEVDKLLSAYSDITSPDFKAWYCKAIYRMGCQRFSDLAEEARKGKTPPRLFSSLIKANMGGRL